MLFRGSCSKVGVESLTGVYEQLGLAGFDGYRQRGICFAVGSALAAAVCGGTDVGRQEFADAMPSCC